MNNVSTNDWKYYVNKRGKIKKFDKEKNQEVEKT